MGLIFLPIPVIGLIAWPLVILGLILSVLGLGRVKQGRATNRGLAIGGGRAVGVGVGGVHSVGGGDREAISDVQEESNREATIVYEVTGTAENVSISYTTFGEGVTTNQETVATL
ncbi:MAG TPA: DUF4190 domain-containing protein, partial [Actinophytocola sp.]|nr:DUF4190 domain-containing protein [Actinophytocola sp.]